jgi:hypothetical protein
MLEYPAQPEEQDSHTGLYPVDFILESILKAGLEWFRTDVGAGKKVYGHLQDPWLAKYGEAKILEIENFIKKYDIRIVQHFALIDAAYPTISIQLLDGSEMTERTSMSDFAGTIDVLDAENEVKGRTEIGYTPVFDNMQIGIHSTITPDMVKYLYYLIVYILTVFKPEMEKRGLQLGTFRATDLSRMNEFLPENMYSRFVNFSVFTIACVDKGAVPIIERIMGVHVNSDNVDNIELGITIDDIDQNTEVGG